MLSIIHTAQYIYKNVYSRYALFKIKDIFTVTFLGGVVGNILNIFTKL